MTEEEAKTKWCFKRERRPAENGPPGRLSASSCCLGSACMAWRYDQRWKGMRPGEKYVVVDRPATPENPHPFVIERGQAPDPLPPENTGYCGIADKP